MLPETAWAIKWGATTVMMCLYFIVFSLGLILTFGFHKVINFAHGALYMVGAYSGLFFYSLTGNFGVAVIGGLASSCILGALFERGLISRLYGKDPANSFLVTFGLGFVLVGIVKAIATGQFRAFPTPELLAGRLYIGGATISTYRLFFIGMALLLIILVYLLLTRTRIGTIVRAGTANRSGVEVLGINIKNYFTLMFVIGSGLAGITGVLFAPLFKVYPFMGDELLLWAFVIIIMGGMGSFWGSIVGGTILGILHSLGHLVFGEYVLFATYVLLIIVLLVRPMGIFGMRET